MAYPIRWKERDENRQVVVREAECATLAELVRLRRRLEARENHLWLVAANGRDTVIGEGHCANCRAALIEYLCPNGSGYHRGADGSRNCPDGTPHVWRSRALAAYFKL